MPTSRPARRLLPALLGLCAAAGPALAQCQLQKLTAGDGAGSDEFGGALHLHRGVALVGATGDDDAGHHSGSVYVLERGPAGWLEKTKLTASDGQLLDSFGYAVAVESGRAAIGSYKANLTPFIDAGAAYVFERDGLGAWTERAKLVARDPAGAKRFGSAIDLSGERVLVGAEHDAQAVPSGGAGYVFRHGPAGWVQEAKLIPGDLVGTDLSGRAVALEGDTAVIGAPLHSHAAPSDGALYVFERGPAGWVQTAELTAPDGAVDDTFAASLALDGDTLWVGAPGDDDAGLSSGSAYVFERGNAGWTLTAKVGASGASAGQEFGTSVAVQGDLAVVGARHASGLAHHTGAAYLFRRAGSAWRQIARVEATDGMLQDFFGGAVALDGEEILIGAVGDDDAGNHTGSGYLFQLPDGVTPFGFCADGPCANPDAAAGCANSTGSGARLAACGSTRASADDLVLELRGLPPGRSALLLRGAATAHVPFGAGLLAVGPGRAGLFRYAPFVIAQSGVHRVGPGMIATAAGQSGGPIQAGETWVFQLVFDDGGGPCGGQHNASNGLAVTFVP